ncbi:MAG: serine hydrolase [bacterium]|nr:serine hydrolase [bacterium]
MNKRLKLGLMLMLITSISWAQERPKPVLDGLEKKIDAQVKKYLDLDIFSGNVLVAENGNILYHKSFGLANRESKEANTINTKFDIGSMNKTFTKLIVLKLLEEKKLKLEDKLGHYLEGFPKMAADNITIAHLLNHTSGYGDYSQTPGFFGAPASEKIIDKLVKRISQMPLFFPPGTDREYSNSGYVLLGAIIEKVSGRTYHDMVQDHIVTPLGLTETYVKEKYTVPNRAIGYLKNMKGELEDNQGFVEVPNPDGGFLSTTSDMLKFHREFFYGDDIVKKKTKLKDEFYSMIQPHQNTGGAIPIAGGFNGANTSIYEILRDKISIIVFANMDEPVAENLGADILSIVRGEKPGEPKMPTLQVVYQALKQNGRDYVKNNFEDLSSNWNPMDPPGIILNMIGYSLMRDGDLNMAADAFSLNTELFPEDPNVWDSYGEVLLNQGKKEEALSMYQKALSIDPEFPSALEKVKELTQ